MIALESEGNCWKINTKKSSDTVGDFPVNMGRENLNGCHHYSVVISVRS
jgi:hypothetical protein